MNRIAAVTFAACIAACSESGGGVAAATADDAVDYFHLSGARGARGARVSFSSVEENGATRLFNDVVIEGPDGSELRAKRIRLVNPRTTDEGAVFDALEFSDLSAVETDGVLTLDRLLIENPNERFAALVAAMLSAEGLDEDADWGRLSDYAFDTLALEGLSATGDFGDFSLAELRWEDVAQGVIGEGSLSDFEVEIEPEYGEAGSIALGEASLVGLDMSTLPPFEALDVDDPDELQAALLASGFNDPFRKTYDSYAVRDLRIDADGVIIALDELEGTAGETRGGLEKTDELRGLVLEFDPSRSSGAEALQGLSMLGYDRLEAEGEFTVLADRQADRIRTTRSELRVADAFTLESSYDVSGVAAYIKNAAKLGLASSVDVDPDELASLLAPLVINNFEVRLTDESFVNRAFEAVAAEQGSTPELMREQAQAFLVLGAMFVPAGPGQALVNDGIEAVSDFLENPGTLRIAVEPAEPVSVAAVMQASQTDPGAAIELLNITIENE